MKADLRTNSAAYKDIYLNKKFIAKSGQIVQTLFGKLYEVQVLFILGDQNTSWNGSKAESSCSCGGHQAIRILWPDGRIWQPQGPSQRIQVWNFLDF